LFQKYIYKINQLYINNQCNSYINQIQKILVANSISIIQGDKVIDLLETVNAVKGLAPATLDSLKN
jgi:hypothetical protein